MGIIDSTHYRLTCEKCGISDTLSSHQYGSSWAPGEWDSLGPSLQFDAVIDAGTKVSGPHVKSAACKKCRAEAKIENGMFSKPTGW